MKNDAYDLLITLLRAALNDTEPPFGLTEAELEPVVKIAKKHHVDNILFSVLKKLDGLSNTELLKKLNISYFFSVSRESNQQYEAERIMNAFEEKKILHLPLKGYVIKHLYKSPDLRWCTDFDIYVPVKFNEDACKVMDGLGYSYDKESIGFGMHDNYHYGRYTEVEIHKSLMAPEFPKLCRFCEELLKNKKLTDGFKYRYEFSKEDYYLYMQLHTIKHLKHTSCGIKPIIDIWVYLKSYGDVLNWKYITSMLKKYDLTTIDANLRALCEYWFDGVTPKNSIIHTLSDYIIDSGAFGTEKQYLSSRKTDDSKLARVFRTAFMPYDEMRLKYPVLKKFPPLLPVMWGHRIINGVIFKTYLISDVVSAKVDIDEKTLYTLSKFKKDLGL